MDALPYPLLLFLCLAVALTSAVSAVMGMAGGMSLLGVFTVTLPETSVVPLHGVIQLCANFTRTLNLLRHVAWRIALPYLPAVTLGTWLGTRLYSPHHLAWFKPGIGAFILLFLLVRRHMPKLRNPPLWSYAALGLCVGFASVFVGATGLVIAPFFFRDDFTKEQVIASQAACQSWTHFLKIPAFLFIGFDFRPWLAPLAILVACSIVGTLAGGVALRKVSQQAFERAFVALLAALAIYLIAASILERVAP